MIAFVGDTDGLDSDAEVRSSVWILARSYVCLDLLVTHACDGDADLRLCARKNTKHKHKLNIPLHKSGGDCECVYRQSIGCCTPTD